MTPKSNISSDHYQGESSTSLYSSQFNLSKLPDEILHWIGANGFDFLTIADELGNILYVSPSVQKVVGYEVSELIGKPTKDFISPSDQPQLLNKFQVHSANAQKINLSFRDNLGKYIWVESVVRCTEIDLFQGKVYIALNKDITDKKEAEEMLIRSEKMSVAGQLAAGVAHEIRNPLTSLKGFIQLLQAGIDKKDEYYKIMIDEINKIDTITSELLFISKPMTDEKKFEKLSFMLKDVVTLLRSQAKLYNIEINLQIEKERMIFCDRTQIKQVLINLIKNAVEEMKEGGTINVVAQSNETNCFISIIDEGPGIPEHILHKLREPFFTTKKDGTGLGLMISYKIIENHQGSIEIQQNKGKGSTFQIILPINHE
ncbi:ATP-binding protein [Aquibacillus koreensis]|uniref:histidine kinase n=1 Tax=Aquibacillus koreensis TaxID=279446 RepID=A0A9X3WJK9_9BACI|nr:ATP-binding protein [Aquibacillus koreensis]MCT2536392.1 ATP-binding protein [Aquibacillus koreensis]MDC3421257.1 ATP-binding protein [Aquibacillus koreensis]